MSLITDFIGGVVTLALRLLFGLAAAVFALSLLAAGLVAVVFMLLRSLLTGQKPAPFRVWQHYRQASRASTERWTNRATTQGDPHPSGSSGATGTPLARGVRSAPPDVEDVTPRDIPPR